MKPGDIIFTFGYDSLISFLIYRITNLFKEKTPPLSHVAYYVGDGYLIEADWKGVVKEPCTKYTKRRYTVITGEVNHNIEGGLRYTHRQLGKRYSYIKIFLIALSFAIPGIQRIYRKKSELICSELVANALNAGGLNLPILVSPNYLYHYTKKNGKIYGEQSA